MNRRRKDCPAGDDELDCPEELFTKMMSVDPGLSCIAETEAPSNCTDADFDHVRDCFCSSMFWRQNKFALRKLKSSQRWKFRSTLMSANSTILSQWKIKLKNFPNFKLFWVEDIFSYSIKFLVKSTSGALDCISPTGRDHCIIKESDSCCESSSFYCFPSDNSQNYDPNRCYPPAVACKDEIMNRLVDCKFLPQDRLWILVRYKLTHRCPN